MSAKRRSRPIVKLLVVCGLLAGLGYLFLHSLESTRSEPYVVDARHVSAWTLALEPARGAGSPLLVLRTGKEVVTDLFSQLFKRSMESMTTAPTASIAVVLHGEYDRGLSGHMTTDQLLVAGRDAGLETRAPELRCLAHRRVSEPGSTRQVYFVLADAPAIGAFRSRLAATAPGAFDAEATSPVMFVGATDAGFHTWLPMKVTDADCVAPVRPGP
jgi:hypothetical protein